MNLAEETAKAFAFAEKHNDKLLTKDEVAAVNMMSMNSLFYKTLTSALRDRNRGKLKAFMPLLKLMLTGLYKLPLVKKTIYRAVRGRDASKTIRAGKTFIWWGFNYGLTKESDLKHFDFLGASGDCTVLKISAVSCVDIKSFAIHQEASDYLVLLPASTLAVDSVMEHPNGMRLIEMHEEICPDFIDYPHPAYLGDDQGPAEPAARARPMSPVAAATATFLASAGGTAPLKGKIIKPAPYTPVAAKTQVGLFFVTRLHCIIH